MANDINLSPARVVRAAIAHVSTNGMKFQEIGTLQAMRSPLLKPMTDELAPKRAKDDDRLSFRKGTGGDDDIIPSITVNFQQQYTPTTKKTVREVATTGQGRKAPVSVDQDFRIYREYSHAFKTVNFIELSKETEDYLAKTKAGITPDIDDKNFNGLKVVGSAMMDTIEMGLLRDMNADGLSALIAGRRGNLVVGQASPANMVEPTIALYNRDVLKTPSRNFWEAMNALKRSHSITGKLIVIGGKMAATYMDLSQILGVNDLGIDQKALYDKLPVEFYYDPAIDALYGQDKILVIDPGAACWQNVPEHKWIVKQRKVANTSFGTMRCSIAQYDSGTFDMEFDLRVQETDQGKYPSWLAIPSTLSGYFVRPAGFFKDYDGWLTVTGIFGYQLTEFVPAA